MKIFWRKKWIYVFCNAMNKCMKGHNPSEISTTWKLESVEIQRRTNKQEERIISIVNKIWISNRPIFNTLLWILIRCYLVKEKRILYIFNDFPYCIEHLIPLALIFWNIFITHFFIIVYSAFDYINRIKLFPTARLY